MKFINFKKIINKTRGFTIVESLVAIFILLVSITGPMYFAQGGLRASFVARDQITAFFLAQDAIEFIKNKRDSNVLTKIGGSGANWLDGLDFCNASGCSIDTKTNNITYFNSNQYLKIAPDTGFLGHTGTTNSIFSRKIQIEEIEANREAKVTVTITWETKESIGPRSITVRENIFNWASNI